MEDEAWSTDDGLNLTPTSAPLDQDEHPVVTQTVLQSVVYVTQTVTAAPTPATQPQGLPGNASKGQADKGMSQGKLAGIIGGSFVAGLVLTMLLVYVFCLAATRASARAKERRANYRRQRRQLSAGRHAMRRQPNSSDQSNLLPGWRRRSDHHREATTEVKMPWPSWSALPLTRPQSPSASDKASSNPRTRPRLNLRPSSAPGSGAPRLPLTFPFGQQSGASPATRSGWRHTVFEALSHSMHGESSSSHGHADWRKPPPFVSVVNCDTYRRPAPESSACPPPSFPAMPRALHVSLGSSPRAPVPVPPPSQTASPQSILQITPAPSKTAPHQVVIKDPERPQAPHTDTQRHGAPPPPPLPAAIGRQTPSEIGTVNTMTGLQRELLRVVGRQPEEGTDSLVSSVGRPPQPRGLRTPASSLPPPREAEASDRSHRRSQSNTHEPPVWWTKAMQTLVPGALQERLVGSERGPRKTSFELLGCSHEGGWSMIDPERRIYPSSLMLLPQLNKSLPTLEAGNDGAPHGPIARKVRSMDGLGSALKERFDFEPTPEVQQSIDDARRHSRLITVDDAAIASATASVPGSPVRLHGPPDSHHEHRCRHPNPVDLVAALAKSVASSLTGRRRERGSTHTWGRSTGTGSQGPGTHRADDFYSPDIALAELEMGIPSSRNSFSTSSTPNFARPGPGRGRYEAVAPSSPRMDAVREPPASTQHSQGDATQAMSRQGTPRRPPRPPRAVRSISTDELAAAPLVL